MERTPAEYVERLTIILREARRVLAAHGTLWLNLGDSYAGSNRGGAISEEAYERLQGDSTKAIGEGGTRPAIQRFEKLPELPSGLKPKDLIGVPWRVAFSLQEDGWYLRSDIIWAKPNPMPESVTDRPTKSHEYIFLLSKSRNYYFDQEAVREPAEWDRWGDQTTPKHNGTQTAAGWIGNRPKSELKPWPGIGKAHTDARAALIPTGNPENEPMVARDTRNVRTVWEIATQAYPEAHFATFPNELVRRCILAGCPKRGVILDPFIGSGTTAKVARDHGRRTIGIELNPDYCELIAKRTQQLSLLSDG